MRSLRFLDGLRGLAALYVMVGHARWLLWEGFTEGYMHHPELYPLPAKLLAYFFALFSFGHQAVLLFFVLSGFVIHLRYSQDLKNNPESARFDWRDFVYRRARRLYPPLIFAMLLTFVLDSTGAAMHFPIYFQQTSYSLINLNVNPHLDLATALGNLTFVMTTYVPVWGSNGPLWSLMFEWWFYMVYPLFWAFSKRSIALATLVMILLFVLSFTPLGRLVALAGNVFSLMLTWWLGALLADVYTGRLSIRFSRIAVLSVLLPPFLVLVIPISNLGGNLFTLQDIIWGYGFAGFIALCLTWQQRGGSLRVLERLKPLGDMSYTLYVIHFPILVFLSGIVMSFSANQQVPQSFSWTFVGILVCLAVAYLVHFFTEKPFTRRRILTETQVSP